MKRKCLNFSQFLNENTEDMPGNKNPNRPAQEEEGDIIDRNYVPSDEYEEDEDERDEEEFAGAPEYEPAEEPNPYMVESLENELKKGDSRKKREENTKLNTNNSKPGLFLNDKVKKFGEDLGGGVNKNKPGISLSEVETKVVNLVGGVGKTTKQVAAGAKMNVVDAYGVLANLLNMGMVMKKGTGEESVWLRGPK